MDADSGKLKEETYKDLLKKVGGARSYSVKDGQPFMPERGPVPIVGGLGAIIQDDEKQEDLIP